MHVPDKLKINLINLNSWTNIRYSLYICIN